MYTHILHATDLHDKHFRFYEQAVRMAKTCQATLSLLHVIHPPTTLQIAQGLGFAEFDKPTEEDAETVLAVLAETFNISPEHLYVKTGCIKTHTTELIQTLGVDLLIIGAHTHSFWSLENNAKHLSDDMPCDVLTLKG